MNVLALDSKYWQNTNSTREELVSVIREAADEAVKLLPAELLYTNIILEPVPSEEVIPETGDTGITYDNTHVYISFDFNLPYGKDTLLSHLRSTTFHELVHAVSFDHNPWQPDALYGAITEGLATVFEREYANSKPLWGKYESDETMYSWLTELQDLPKTEAKDMNYFIKHPDGRKWIVYKTGTWVVDTLLDSGENLFDLMQQDYVKILEKFSHISK